VKRASTQHGLVGSAVVGQKVTDFVDLRAVLDSSGEHIFGDGRAGLSKMLVMVAGPSALERGLVRSYVEMTDCHVIEASTLEEVLDRSQRQRMDAVIAGESFASSLRSRLPDVQLFEFGDRDAMIRSIQSLAMALAERDSAKQSARKHDEVTA
jgi:hypothetical protein